MYLKKVKKFTNSKNLVLVGDKSTKFSIEIDETIKKQFSTFLKGEKDIDYVKSFDQLIIFVKGSKDHEKLRISGFNARKIVDQKAKEITVIGDKEMMLSFAEGFALSNYQFLKYLKDASKKKNALETIFLLSDVSDKLILEYNSLIKSVFWARDMVNEPVSYLNATKFAEEIKNLAITSDLSVEIYEKSKIESLKMGGLLAVNKGSIDPPTFTVVEYKPKKITNKKPIVLVGKGVVYDTGGLSLKPTPGSMDCMKSDMGGGASVIGAIYAAAANNLDKHVIALVPATDNRPGLNAYAPGDIVKMYDGTTVEVLNTDAEGRMILADALAYSKKFNPELVIDSATLTGAALRAIGTKAACIMGNASDKVFAQLIKSGEQTHERVVQLPFWDDYMKEMKSDIADLKNIGGSNAGMITAGKFLEHFVKAPYVHIDIAGPAWLDSPEDYKGKAGTGYGVRLLYDFMKNYK
jgi:leucyl aminopeptidase